MAERVEDSQLRAMLGKRRDERLQLRDESGLLIRVTKTGTISFSVVYRVRGRSKQRRMTLGAYPETKLREARNEAKMALLTAKRGKDPSGEKDRQRKASEAPTVRDVFALYAAERKRRGMAENTLKADRVFFRSIEASLGDTPVDELTKEAVESVVNRYLEEGQPGTAHRVRTALAHMLDWSEHVPEGENPARRVSKVRPAKPRDRVLSEAEIRDVWNATSEPTKTGQGIRLSLLTAQRRQEVSLMRVDEIEETKGGPLWVIPSANTKSARKLHVPLSGHAVSEIERARTSDCPFVLSSPLKEGPINQGSLSQAARELALAFRHPRWTFHDLRRTAATMMVRDLRVDVALVGMILGHSMRGVTSQVYVVHRYIPEMREALESWGERVREIVASARD